MHYSLTILRKRVVIRIYGPAMKCRTEKVRPVESVTDYLAFIIEETKRLKCSEDDLCVMCSSSMDFPKESTNNKATIKLANDLRGDNLSKLMEAERAKMGSGSKLSRKHRHQLTVIRDHLLDRVDSLRADMTVTQKRCDSLAAQLGLAK